MTGSRKVGAVCVVTEVDQQTSRSHLYGVFTDESMARADYGATDSPRYVVQFDTVPLFGKAPEEPSTVPDHLPDNDESRGHEPVT